LYNNDRIIIITSFTTAAICAMILLQSANDMIEGVWMKMSGNKREQRLQSIISYLKHHSGASIHEIATAMEMSDITTRRDLYELRDRNLIHYISGVAIYSPPLPPEHDPAQKPYKLCAEKQVNFDKKAKIGRLASTLLQPGDNIIIDTGSTTEQFAQQIPENMPMTALCYNVNIMNELVQRREIKLLSAGGTYHRNTQMFESPEWLELINRTRASKVFLSAAGVSEQLGITCVNQYEVPVKKAIIEASLSRILLVDSSKFDVIRPAFFAQLSVVDMIVTDDGISQCWIDLLCERNIQLHIAR